MDINGEGFLFSVDGGVKPISRNCFNKQLETALASIGIDKVEKRKRNLSPHSWRYFLNTNLLVSGVAKAKVQQITGHKTEAMTEKYTHFYSEEFVEVRNLQDQLLLPDGQGGPQTGAPTGEVIDD